MSSSRRDFLKTAAVASVAMTAKSAYGETEGDDAPSSPWPLCLNTSTIRPTPLRDKIRIAAETGWDAIELWMNDLEKFESAGGSLKELGEEIKSLGLFVPNVIGLWNCMPDTRKAFDDSLKETRNRMRIAAAVGSKHVAAIPAPDRAPFDLAWATECYKELLKIGREEYGIVVAMEFVGFFKGVHRLGQAALVALDADDEDARLVTDTFHLFRGGSGFNGLTHLQGDFIAVFHWNDVPANTPCEEMKDQDRILPGDGMLPLSDVLKDLLKIGYRGPLSLELFKRDLWKKDPKEVSALGLRKMRECVQAFRI